MHCREGGRGEWSFDIWQPDPFPMAATFVVHLHRHKGATIYDVRKTFGFILTPSPLVCIWKHEIHIHTTSFNAAFPWPNPSPSRVEVIYESPLRKPKFTRRTIWRVQFFVILCESGASFSHASLFHCYFITRPLFSARERGIWSENGARLEQKTDWFTFFSPHRNGEGDASTFKAAPETNHIKPTFVVVVLSFVEARGTVRKLFTKHLI